MGGNKEEDDEPDKMQIAFGRISRFIGFIKSLPKTLFRIMCRRKKVGDKPVPLSINGKEPNGYPEKNGKPSPMVDFRSKLKPK